jgi:hypothetical protein
MRRSRFFVGYTASRFCDDALVFLIPLLVYKVTGDVAKSGLTLAIEWVPRLAVLPFVGTLVDQRGARTMVLMAEILRILSCIGVAITLAFVPGTAFYVLSLLAVFIGIVAEIGYVSNEVLLVDVFVGGFRVAQKWSQAVDQALRITCPPVAAFLLVTVPLPIILLGFATLVSVNLLIILTQTRASPMTGNKEPVLCALLRGWRVIWVDSRLLAICGVAFLLNLSSGIVLSTMNHFVVGIFRSNESGMAALATSAGIASIIALKLLREREQGTQDFIVWSLVLVSCFFLMSHARILLQFAALYVIFSVAAAMLSLFIRSTRAQLAPDGDLGKLVGTMIFLNSSSLPLAGYFVYSYAGVALGTVWTAAAVALLMAIIAYLVADCRSAWRYIQS